MHNILKSNASFIVAIILYLLIILLCYISEIKEINIIQFSKGFGAIFAIYLLYRRFKTTDDIKKNQEEQFHLTNQYSHFLETSKLLTDKDSTIEAKISAMYLLYDYAKNHPQEVEKVYQLLSEYINPLLNCINDDCNHTEYIKIKDTLEVEKKSKKTTFKFEKQKKLNLDFNNPEEKIIEKIYSWNNNGTDEEREIAVALIILRDLSINVLPKINNHIDLSNIIIFNLNIDFIQDEQKKNIRFKSKIRPTYTLIFLGCNLDNVDFSDGKFYFCKFINCNLKKANFNSCNLKGTRFIDSDLSNSNFNNAKLQKTFFKDCKLKNIKFDNINISLKNFKEYNEI